VLDDRVTALGNFTALVPVNNTLVITLAGSTHAASSWPRNSLPVSLDTWIGFSAIMIAKQAVVLHTFMASWTFDCLKWQNCCL